MHALLFAELKRSVTVSVALFRITATEDGTLSLRFWKKFYIGNSGTIIYGSSDNVGKIIPTRRARRV